jgi:hypothetical protein
MIENIPKSDTVIILGDFNAQLGKEEAYIPINGKHMLHEKQIEMEKCCVTSQ